MPAIQNGQTTTSGGHGGGGQAEADEPSYDAPFYASPDSVKMERTGQKPPALSDGHCKPEGTPSPLIAKSVAERDVLARQAFPITIQRLAAAMHAIHAVQTSSLVGAPPLAEQALADAVIEFSAATEKLPEATQGVFAACQQLPRRVYQAPQQPSTMTNQQPSPAQQDHPVKSSLAAAKVDDGPQVGSSPPSSSSNRAEPEPLSRQIERQALMTGEGRLQFNQDLERYHEQRLALPPGF